MARAIHAGTVSFSTLTVGTTVNISLPSAFATAGAPNYMRFWTYGRSDASDAVGNQSVDFSMGLAVSTSSRGCFAGHIDDGAISAQSDQITHNDCVIALLSHGSGASSSNGKVDINSISSTQVQLIVDEALPNALVIGYEFMTVENAALVHLTEGASLSVSGLAFQPDYGEIIFGGGTSLGTATTSFQFSYGVFNSTQQSCIGVRDNDGAATMNGARGMYTNRVVHLMDLTAETSGNAADLQVSFSSFNSDGVTFTVNETTGSTLGFCLLTKGASTFIENFQEPTSGSTTTRTSYGFQPMGLAGFSSAGTIQTADAAQSQNRLFFGVAADENGDGTVEHQHAQAYSSADSTTSTIGVSINYGAFMTNVQSGGTEFNWSNVDSFTSDGVIYRNNVANGNLFIVVRAVRPPDLTVGGGNQTLTPGAVASTVAIGTVAVALGARTLTPSAVVSAQIAVPSVTIPVGGATVITPSAVASTRAVPSVTIALGTRTVTPNAVTTTKAVPNVTVARGLRTLAVSPVTGAVGIPAVTISGGIGPIPPVGVVAAKTLGRVFKVRSSTGGTMGMQIDAAPGGATPGMIVIPGASTVMVFDASWGPQFISVWNYSLCLSSSGSEVDTETTADATFTSVAAGNYFIRQTITVSGQQFTTASGVFSVGSAQLATPTVDAGVPVGLTIPIAFSAVVDEAVVEERRLYYSSSATPTTSDPFVLLAPSAVSYDFVASGTGTWHFALMDIAIPGEATDSALSAEDTAVISSSGSPPDAVTLSTPVATSWNRVPLVWTNGATPGQHNIHRSTTSPVPVDGSALLQGELDLALQTWTDATTAADTTYYYKIEDINVAGNAFSNEVSVLTPSQSSWPNNDPSDGTWVTFVDSNGSDPYYGYTAASPGPWNFGQQWLNTARVLSVSDPEAPDGTAIEHRWFVGEGDGWKGFANRGLGQQSQIYVRYVLKLSDNYDYHSGGDKLIMLNLPGGRTGAFYIGKKNGGLIYFRCQKGSGPHQGIFEPVDTTTYKLVPGAYHTIELHMICQSASGVADGQVRMWFDGFEITDWKLQGTGTIGALVNMNFVADGGSTKINGWQQPEYWGGQGDTKTVDDYLRYARFVVKGKV